MTDPNKYKPLELKSRVTTLFERTLASFMGGVLAGAVLYAMLHLIP